MYNDQAILSSGFPIRTGRYARPKVAPWVIVIRMTVMGIERMKTDDPACVYQKALQRRGICPILEYAPPRRI